MVLRPGRGDGADRSAMITTGFLFPRAVRRIDRVLQHAGDRIVVFRCDEQDAVGGAHGCSIRPASIAGAPPGNDREPNATLL